MPTVELRMKAPAVATLLTLVAVLAALAISVRQGGTIRELRQEVLRLASDSTAPAVPETPAQSAPAVAAMAGGDALTEAEHLELLRLRGQVTLLRSQVRGVTPAQQENAALKERLARAKANPGSPQSILPPGYLLRRQARMAGQGSPEAALETFLWAIEHRDFATLQQVLTGDMARELSAQFGQQGAEAFWKSSGALPGFRVTGKKALPDGSVQMGLSFDLEESAMANSMSAHLIDGQWRLNMR